MITIQEEGVRQPQPFNELLTIGEVARHLRVNTTTVRRWIKSGVLEAVTLPHNGNRRGYRVRKQTLALLLKNSTMLD
jgi:excisionase family DNA binding protein